MKKQTFASLPALLLLALCFALPAGAAAERHEPVPFDDNVAVQSDVEPAVNATDPVGVGAPPAPVVTVAE